MDRRALLAIVISTLLIIVYEVVFLPAPPPPVGDEVGDRVPGPGEIAPLYQEETLAEEVAQGSAPEPVEDVAAQTVSISTPLYTTEIETRGGLLGPIRLLAYLGVDGEPVALTRAQDPGGLGLVLNTGDGEIDLRGVVFRSDRSRVRLVGGEEEGAVTLEQVLANGISVQRTYSFRGDSYRIDVHQQIRRQGAAPEIFSYRLLWEAGIAFTEGDPVFEKGERGVVTAVGTEIVRDRLGKVGKTEGVQRAGNVQWTALKGKYFAIALIPFDEPDADVWIREREGEERLYLDVKFPVRSTAGSDGTIGVYAGPIELNALSAEGVGLEGMIDFGWPIIRPVSRLMLVSLTFLYKFVPNYGWVIVITSLVTKLLFYRLTHKSFQSMKDMQKIQGQVAALKEKYKGDPQRLNKETWALYKKEGVNPMGGCFPMLLQMPVFIALYTVLRSTIELRQAEFFGWIRDLSRPDVLFEMPAPLPFLGENFCLLPILMGISMFFQQKMTTVDPRQKAMIYLMPILFTVLFYRLPSGLVLYWLVNNVLSIGQQWIVHRGGGSKPTGLPEEGQQHQKKRDTRTTNRSNKGRGRKRSLPAKETA